MQISDLSKDLDPYAALWHVVSEFSLKSDEWLLGSLHGLNPEDVDDLVRSFGPVCAALALRREQGARCPALLQVLLGSVRTSCHECCWVACSACG